jgi:MoaA/NifB/PqqE/SkfB family radical SAM enzyme
MYALEDIVEAHVEVTTRCNAACPQCPRNYSGGPINEAMPEAELSLEQVRQIFDPAFVRQLRHLYLCGNYGDPAVAADTLEILAHLRGVSRALRLGLHTNGGVRPKEWWRRLAGVVDYCRFSIDGLEDTNHLYRRHTVWARIMENARSFIAAGGWAAWDFIVFRHNQHQVQAAKRLSAEMGFQEFSIKRTNRFFDPDTAGERPREVLDPRGAPERALEPPDDAGYRNRGVLELVARCGSVDELHAELDRSIIRCRARSDRSIYVSAEGLAFPCAYTAHIYLRGRDPSQHPVVQLLARAGLSLGDLDARRHPLREIVAGRFFQDAFAASWSRPSIEAGRLAVCARVCGSAGAMFDRDIVRERMPP